MMELGKENYMTTVNNREGLAFIIGGALVAVTAMICVTFFQYNQTLAVKSSVESAIVKGIDPMSVRCAYGATDVVCVAYASRK
jgi:hypothetical protein